MARQVIATTGISLRRFSRSRILMGVYFDSPQCSALSRGPRANSCSLPVTRSVLRLLACAATRMSCDVVSAGCGREMCLDEFSHPAFGSDGRPRLGASRGIDKRRLPAPLSLYFRSLFCGWSVLFRTHPRKIKYLVWTTNLRAEFESLRAPALCTSVVKPL
jgi:hypothetical protein